MTNKTSLLILVLVIVAGVFYYLNPAGLWNGNQLMQNPLAGNPQGQKETLMVGPTNDKNDIIQIVNSSNGSYIADQKGMTLYTFSDDKRLTSNCNSDCIKAWPPFLYDGKNFQNPTNQLSKGLNVFKRSNGLLQYALGVSPLYYYGGDKKPGEANGTSVNEKWKVALPN